MAIYDPLDYENLAKGMVDALLAMQVMPLPPPKDSEDGCGIYALYYQGRFKAYRPISSPSCIVPIYVGKAVSTGARMGGSKSSGSVVGRLIDHAKSVASAENLSIDDFKCRYLLVKDTWTVLAEQFLIRRYVPVWNGFLDGFGNHAPGGGRSTMIRPRWDTMHPGREWAARLKEEHSVAEIEEQVRKHFEANPPEAHRLPPG